MSKIAHFGVSKWEEEIWKSKITSFDQVFLDSLSIDNEIEKVKDCQILTVFIHQKVSASVVKKLPNLKLIVTRSTGFDHIDLQACRERNIAVCNVPSYGENTIAEYAFALLLSLMRNIGDLTDRSRNFNFEFSDLRGQDLSGKTIGILGAGKIGQHAIKIARGFGMNIVVYDVVFNPFLAEILNFEYLPLDQVLNQSDIISVHTPYNKYTHHLLGKDQFDQMKKDVVLINTARGPVVDTQALVDNLKSQKVAAAGLDVVENETDLHSIEPNSILHQLINHPKVILTPHVAFYTEQAEERILETAINNVRNFLVGKISNQVN